MTAVAGFSFLQHSASCRELRLHKTETKTKETQFQVHFSCGALGLTGPSSDSQTRVTSEVAAGTDVPSQAPRSSVQNSPAHVPKPPTWHQKLLLRTRRSRAVSPREEWRAAGQCLKTTVPLVLPGELVCRARPPAWQSPGWGLRGRGAGGLHRQSHALTPLGICTD